MATFLVPTRSKTNYVDLNSTQNIVHPEWELTDPTPDVFSLFRNFNDKFFLGKLHCVELEWSKKMYQCAGICYMRKSSRHMACTIRLSEPLLKLRSRKELIETLLHEMIHAWNFVLGIYEENGGHGKNFKAKMEEINRKAGTNITVYHTFHEEVELYKTHWWKCDGPCSKSKPYYGIVKRVSNRAPGPNDFWWAQHQSTCGGKFIKIKEPEKKQKEKKVKAPKASGSSGDIRKYFPVSPRTSSQSSTSEVEDDDFETDDFGVVVPKDFTKPLPKPVPTQKGNTLGGKEDGKSKLLDNIPSTSTSSVGGTKLGGGGNGRSRLLDMYEKNKAPGPSEKKIKLEEPTNRRKSMSQKILAEFDDDDIILIDDEFDDALGETSKEINEKKVGKTNDTCHCPICNKAMSIEEINNHLDECLNNDVVVID